MDNPVDSSEVVAAVRLAIGSTKVLSVKAGSAGRAVFGLRGPYMSLSSGFKHHPLGTLDEHPLPVSV